MLRGKFPRSPVWLRKIPSTVSGSQGSRRGFAPAVRFAFPLGARLNTTLRARPCQELFSESFSRPSRGPRGAPPSGLLPFAAASSVLYAPPGAPGAGNPPAHRMPTTPARRSGGDGGIGLALRPAPHAGPPGRPTQPHASSCLYIGRKIGHAFGPGVFRAVVTQAALPPVAGFPPFASAKLLTEGVASRKKNGRLRARPPSARAIPSATTPGRFSLYIYRDMFSSDCRRCAWSSLPNAATRPWGRLSLQACSQSSP